MSSKISIYNTTKQTVWKSVDFELIKNEILGVDYTLSIILCADKLARRLNFQYRKKTYIPNTLSFPYDRHNGELIINLKKCKTESKFFDHAYREHIIYLFIHSLLHLKGYTHGHKMEQKEKFFFNKYRNS